MFPKNLGRDKIGVNKARRIVVPNRNGKRCCHFKNELGVLNKIRKS